MAPSHPNRSGAGPSRNPTPEEIRDARSRIGHSQKAAADMIHATERAWQEWEAASRKPDAVCCVLEDSRAAMSGATAQEQVPRSRVSRVSESRAAGYGSQITVWQKRETASTGTRRSLSHV